MVNASLCLVTGKTLETEAGDGEIKLKIHLVNVHLLQLPYERQNSQQKHHSKVKQEVALYMNEIVFQILSSFLHNHSFETLN